MFNFRRKEKLNTKDSYLSHLVEELKTGQGIYNVSTMAENLRNTALPYFKDFKGNQILRLVTAEHLLLKWKAYNVACGFVKLDEKSTSFD